MRLGPPAAPGPVHRCADRPPRGEPSTDATSLQAATTLTTLGYGSGNLDDGVMEAVSNAGNGTYAVIANEAHAKSYVERRLLSGLMFVAKDMTIQVSFNPDEALAYRLLGYENRAIADDDFSDDSVDAGEVGAGHSVAALCVIVPVGSFRPHRVRPPSCRASLLPASSR